MSDDTCRFSDDGQHHPLPVSARHVKRRRNLGIMGDEVTIQTSCRACMQPAIVRLTRGLLGNRAVIRWIVR